MPEYNCLFHNPQSAEFYENCRFVPQEVLVKTSQFIWSQYHDIRKYLYSDENKIIDAGVGNGRLFIPMLKTIPKIINNSINLIGLDLAEPMLNNLRELVQKDQVIKEKNISIINWDLQDCYPKSCENASVIYTLATFHILRKWENALNNVFNSLIRNGVFIYIKEINQFMHQTEGFNSDDEIDTMDDSLKEFMIQYHNLRNQYNIPYYPSGIMYSNISLMIKELIRIGFTNYKCYRSEDLKWSKPHKYNDMLHSLEYRLITTWGSDIPDSERKLIASDLRTWLLKKEISLTEVFYIPARFELHCFQKA